MAEAVAGLWAAEEAVSTTAQLGVAAYMVSKPSMPLKGVFTQIASASDDETRLSLARADHSLSIIGNKAFIFGGETAAGKLATTDVHAITLASADQPEPDYALIPAVPDQKDGKLPVPRKKHAACAFNVCVAVFGGIDESGKVIDEGSTIWLFNTAKSTWETLQPSKCDDAAPRPRSGGKLFNLNNNLVLYGGHDVNGNVLKDVWEFDYVKKEWIHKQDAPVWSPNATLTEGVLYLISGHDEMSGDLHFMPLAISREEQEWHSVPFPTNPMTPGPKPRHGAGLVPISTGHGRHYLIYMLGAREPGAVGSKTDDVPPPAEEGKPEEPQYWSDMWTYQLPSAMPAPESQWNLSAAFNPASIKDSIRSALGYDSGQHSWSEIEVLPPPDLELMAGKVHPGPRGFFGCDVMEDGRNLVLWGGVNAKGEKEGDGWIVKLQ
ncbi:galactose oxidase [Hortaea werneckii]|nr:galactose oxidase [Hortaea werneckii]KAI7573493.1 galactose oxidase [Hortaea werneckii]RMX98863.1 hypothetical protein D0868_09858 [Hortaea werneckii]